MPQRRSGIKELRKNRRKRMQNMDVKTGVRKTIKTYLTAVKDNNKSEAEANLKTVYKKLDKAAKKGVIHKNTASRRKSRFSKELKNISA